MKKATNGGKREGSGRKKLDKVELHPRVPRALKEWIDKQAKRTANVPTHPTLSPAQFTAQLIQERAAELGFSSPNAKPTA